MVTCHPMSWIRSHSRRLFAAAFVLLAGMLEGQTPPIPPAPADGIRDDARAMTIEGRKSVAAEMQKFEHRTGIALFVDTNTYLEGDQTAMDRSRALIAGWIGHRPGLVFCLNRGARPVPLIFFSKELSERYPEPDLSLAAAETMESMARVSAPENRLPVGVRVMMNRLRALESANASRNRLFHRHDIEMMAGFGALLFVTGLIALLIIRFHHKEEAIEAVKHQFPDVEVSQRFSAPGGGGVIVEVSYRRLGELRNSA